ncbi:MAG: ABC transporter permease [Lachnospiraceae bacterium]|nr:ABC transporter permease [Lachnospiraceae bacterium]
MQKKSNTPYHLHIDADVSSLSLRLGEVWHYRDLIWLHTRKNFVVRYKQTILGPVWLIINPLLSAIAYYIVFGRIAGMGTGGIPQLLFYISGNAFWSFMSGVMRRCSATFSGNAYLFGKIYFPRLTIPLSNILIHLIEFAIQLAITIVISFVYLARGIHALYYTHLVGLIPLLLWAAMLGMGLGIILSGLTAKYRDLSILIGIGTRVWLFASPVVYPLSQVQDSIILKIIRFNPAVAPLELFRYVLYGVGEVTPGSVLYSLIFSAAVLIAGLLLFNRVERTFIDTI